MLEIVKLILPVFLLLGAGALLRVLKVANDEWVEILNRYGLYIGFPALVLESLIQIDKTHFVYNIIIYRWNVFLILGIIFIILIIVKASQIRKEISNPIIICSFFGNIAYLGYPIVTSVYKGVEGEVSILIAIYVVILFTLGIGILEVSRSRRLNPIPIFVNIIKNPLFLSIPLGLLFIQFDVKLPIYIDTALKMLKASASPVVIIAIGIFITRKIEVKGTFFYSLVIIFLRIILIPLLFYFFARITRLLPSFNTSILEAAMPIGLTPFALSYIYPMDREIVVSSIVLSTLLSIVTLPLFFYILKVSI